MSGEFENAHLLNSSFLEKAGTDGGMQKFASLEGEVIVDRVRTESMFKDVLPVKPVSPGECQRDEHSDTLYKLVYLTPNSRAMSMSFRGNARSQLVRGAVTRMSFFKIESHRYEKNEEEILAYGWPITDWIEKNIPLDLQSIRDRYLLLHCEAAVQELQLQENAGATKLSGDTVYKKTVKLRSITKGANAVWDSDSGGDPDADDTPYPIKKTDLPRLARLFPGNNGTQLAGKRLLWTVSDAVEVSAWTAEEIGSKGALETAVDGWGYSTLVGWETTQTNKTDILRAGNVYAFTDDKYLGQAGLLQKVKLFVHREGDRFRFWGWELFGAVLAQIEAVRKMELYPASVAPGALTGTTADHLPMAEDEIGRVNNQVDAGKVYPSVTQY